MDHKMIATALDIDQSNGLSSKRDAFIAAQTAQDPNWLQTVGYVGQALNLLGVSGVTINRDSPDNSPPSSQTEAPQSEGGASPLIFIAVGGVVLLVLVVVLLKKD
jgi:hypothetical protein